jgi:hypothetical protein
MIVPEGVDSRFFIISPKSGKSKVDGGLLILSVDFSYIIHRRHRFSAGVDVCPPSVLP